jgi:hypothetical protein
MIEIIQAVTFVSFPINRWKQYLMMPHDLPIREGKEPACIFGQKKHKKQLPSTTGRTGIASSCLQNMGHPKSDQ